MICCSKFHSYSNRNQNKLYLFITFQPPPSYDYYYYYWITTYVHYAIVFLPLQTAVSQSRWEGIHSTCKLTSSAKKTNFYSVLDSSLPIAGQQVRLPQPPEGAFRQGQKPRGGVELNTATLVHDQHTSAVDDGVQPVSNCQDCAIFEFWIIFWIIVSVSRSIEAVASSITKIFGLRKMARPMQISWTNTTNKDQCIEWVGKTCFWLYRNI